MAYLVADYPRATKKKGPTCEATNFGGSLLGTQRYLTYINGVQYSSIWYDGKRESIVGVPRELSYFLVSQRSRRIFY